MTSSVLSVWESNCTGCWDHPVKRHCVTCIYTLVWRDIKEQIKEKGRKAGGDECSADKESGVMWRRMTGVVRDRSLRTSCVTRSPWQELALAQSAKSLVGRGHRPLRWERACWVRNGTKPTLCKDLQERLGNCNFIPNGLGKPLENFMPLFGELIYISKDSSSFYVRLWKYLINC